MLDLFWRKQIIKILVVIIIQNKFFTKIFWKYKQYFDVNIKFAVSLIPP